MKRALAGLLLAACATMREAEDEDDRRLARTADQTRAGETTSSDDVREPERKEPERREPERKERRQTSGAYEAYAKQAAESAGKMQEAMARTDSECAALNAAPVSYEEERTMGGNMAIAYAKSGKGLYLDATPAAAPAPGMRGGVELPKGPKNDLTAYVQVVGQWLARGSSRPGIAWTFAVIDNDETVAAWSTMGGWVLVTTGMLKLMDNEAQLAGVLAREISLVASRVHVKQYSEMRSSTCRQALMGYYLVEAGAGSVPGGDEFMRNAKFGKTMKALAKGGTLDKDPDVDAEFIAWYTNRAIDLKNLMGLPKEDQLDADRRAVELMAAAGYDPREYVTLIAKFPSSMSLLQHIPSNDMRIDALKNALEDGQFGAGAGKAPKFPSGVQWPPKPAN